MSDLDKLIEAVDGGAVRPWVIEEMAALIFHNSIWPMIAKSYDGSLDAAKSLHEALLQDWVFDITNDGGLVCPKDYMTFGELPDHIRAFDDYSGDPARSWLIAILKAYEAQHTVELEVHK